MPEVSKNVIKLSALFRAFCPKKSKMDFNSVLTTLYICNIKAKKCLKYSHEIYWNYSCYYLFFREYLHDCVMQLIRVFIWHMTAECDCFVSSLEFSVAQWLDYLARVWKAVGSFPIWNLDSFSEFFSPHIFFYFFISSSEYWITGPSLFSKLDYG